MVIGAALGAVMVLSVGAASTEWSLPSARGYKVQVGSLELWAKSIETRGSVSKLETDSGTLWLVNGALVTPKD